MAFFAIVGALAVLNVAVAHPPAPYPASFGQKGPCPKPPLPEIVPLVIQSYLPAPVNIGPAAPGVIEHASAPYEINYFEKPWILKHKQGAALNVFTQTPVVVDDYTPPAFEELAAPAGVIVEEKCPEVPAPVAVPAPKYAAPGPVYGIPPPPPAPCH